MKRLVLAMCFVFFIPFLSSADEVDKGLPADTSAGIKQSTRQVIQAGVEPATAIKMTQSMISDGFTEAQVISGHALLIKAKKQNLAEEPIINKLHEGIAKNVAADRILQAMDTVRSRYETANTYTQDLKAGDTQSKVLAKQMAECMAAGIDSDSMNKIVEMLQKETEGSGRDDASKLTENTLETARTLARAGVDSKDIVDVMSNAFNRDYSAGDMEKLNSTFMTQVRGSSSAPELARAYSDAIRNGATPENLGTFDSQMVPDRGFAGGGNTPSGGGIGIASAPPGGSGTTAGGISSGSTPPGGGSGAPAGGGIGTASAPPGGNMGSGSSGVPASPPPGSAPGGDR